jgi:hypothetical protein
VEVREVVRHQAREVVDFGLEGAARSIGAPASGKGRRSSPSMKSRSKAYRQAVALPSPSSRWRSGRPSTQCAPPPRRAPDRRYRSRPPRLRWQPAQSSKAARSSTKRDTLASLADDDSHAIVFSSCGHTGPVGIVVAGVSRQGRMKPRGARRSRASGERINMDAGNLSLEAERARGCVGLYLVQPRRSQRWQTTSRIEAARIAPACAVSRAMRSSTSPASTASPNPIARQAGSRGSCASSGCAFSTAAEAKRIEEAAVGAESAAPRREI